MDRKDLRIGDRVKYGDYVITVWSVGRESVMNDVDGVIPIDRLDPIYLSKELLLELGFKETIIEPTFYIHFNNGFVNTIEHEDGLWYVEINNNIYESIGSTNIDSIHQLQHFVWDCLHQELKFI